jgi:hypothetical protein
MAKRAGAYKSEKRKKELVRKKKQEEKRQKRLKQPETRSDENEQAGESVQTGTI